MSKIGFFFRVNDLDAYVEITPETIKEDLDKLLKNFGVVVEHASKQGWEPKTYSPPTEQPSAGTQVKGPTCGGCGSIRVFKEGKSKKTGQAWRAWMCPNNKCESDPVWISDDEEPFT